MEENRQKWLETLEIVAQKRPDEAEQEWAWVMKELGLEAEYFLAIHEVVKQGRWREAENPAGYLKLAAKREGRRLNESGERKPRGLRGFRGLIKEEEEIPVGSLGMDGRMPEQEDLMDYLQYRQESGQPTQDPDGVWRSAPPLSTDHEGLFTPSGKRLRLPKGLKMGGGSFKQQAERVLRLREALGKDTSGDPYIDEEAERVEVSPAGWQKWAAEAGLSDWEKKVIEYKMSGVGWTEAMAAQTDDETRRALQAAWRKLDRTGKERMREAAKNIFPQDVREEVGNDTGFTEEEG